MTMKRAGGRKVRHALRTNETLDDKKAVHPGESGGRYHPLTKQDVEHIHVAILDVLEQIGLSQALPSCIELVTRAGGRYTDDGRLLFPRSMVEDTVATAARNITLCGQDPQHDLHLQGNKVHFGVAGAAVHVVDDWKTSLKDGVAKPYRDSTLCDLYDAARLVNYLEHIHFFQRCLVARDIVTPSSIDLNTCYAAISGTAKHVGISFTEPEHVLEALQMLHMVAGGEKKWRQRPFASAAACFVVPPLRFAHDACKVMEACVQGGMPIKLLAAGQAGATSPASLAGSVVQEMAEVLAGLVYVNLLVPGHPAILCPWPFVSDLRTGSMSGGSGEQAVLMAACGQMGRYYDLPTSIAASMTDAKIPDAQSGYEKAYTAMLAGHSGANMVHEAAGMQASLLGFSFEGCVIDNDMLGAINRSVRGIEVNTDSLSVQVMRDVCIGGVEHYLSHAQTLDRMEQDYIYPEVSDRLSPSQWEESGSNPVNVKAKAKAKEILATHFPQHIPPSLDDQIRQKFEILLPRQQMKPQ